MSWNQIVVLGVLVNVATFGLGWRARGASAELLERRCRWAIRLALGLAAVLLASVLVPLARFAWLSAQGAAMEERALMLGASIGAGMNLVMGFLAFGTFPTGMAFRLARLAQPETAEGETSARETSAGATSPGATSPGATSPGATSPGATSPGGGKGLDLERPPPSV